MITTARADRPLASIMCAVIVASTVLALAVAASMAQSAQVVRVVSDSSGERLEVDGRDLMVFGMNWDYSPIGTNYNYILWDQPDEFIEAALAREMPLLRDMGVNVIRVYSGIPARWIRHIYEQYGIYTVVNHPMARYGFIVDGAWTASVNYADPGLRAAVKTEIIAMVDELRDTPGLLMWLLGNENNYGLTWTTFAAEALPKGEQDAARARQLYSLFGEVIDAIKARDPNRPVAIANGDVQYIDIIAQECEGLDVLGCNVYRGISARDLFQVVKDKLGVPVMFTEFGSDAWNAREMREDQVMQARYLTGQWQEIYEMSAGKGRAGNAIGGFIFQWSDGWWKFEQESRLDIHDTNASWPNGGYTEDYVEGDNNMNEEWWGITAKGMPDARGLYDVYPRAAYFALRQAFRLDPYAPGTNLDAIRAHFAAIHPAGAALEARGSTASLASDWSQRLRVAGVRLEFETFNTGGSNVTTPESSNAAVPSAYPAFQGFDQMESFYFGVEARPTEAVRGMVLFNVLGNVPTNPIDEIFYENRGRPRTVESDAGTISVNSLERTKVYQASVSWDDRWFALEGFYRVGHLHWQYEGDFFGLYRDAFYGENLDIYNGEAPVGLELRGKKDLTGATFAYGPQLWWGANPSILFKYTRQLGRFNTTAVYQEDIDDRSSVPTTSVVIPLPPTRKATLQVATSRAPFGVEVGGIWSGSTKQGEQFQIAEIRNGAYVILGDEVKDADAFGGKAKVTYEQGRWHAYAQGAVMGLVAEGGPTAIPTFTGWRLRDSGSGNQSNFLTGLAVNLGNFQVAPNFLYQKPLVDPIPGNVPAPGRPRNVLDDPFAVRANRETTGIEILVGYDPTPATWMWQWDNDAREDARFAAALGYVFRHCPTTQDASIYIDSTGVTTFPFPGAPPANDLWEVWARILASSGPDLRLVASIYCGNAEPNGWDYAGNPILNREIHRFGAQARLALKQNAFEAAARFNDWGPYDYHRDFNLTFPVQLMGDVSRTLGLPRWFSAPQTRVGVRGTWRSLDENSNRYLAADPDNGSEWEVRTYLHLSM
jgi:hypothetical protein